MISGTAHCTANGITQAQPPETYILHHTNVVRVMETDDGPLIAACTWSGEVRTLLAYSD